MLYNLDSINSSSITTELASLGYQKKKNHQKLVKELLTVLTLLEHKAKKSKAKRAPSTDFSDPVTEGVKFTRPNNGLFQAMDALTSMTITIQGLQNIATLVLEKIAKIIADQSNEENAELDKISERMQDEKGDDLTADQAKFNLMMTKYNNMIQTSQTESQNYSTLVSDQSKDIKNYLTQEQGLIGVLQLVSRLLA